ncbi:tetratricopeptide repeat protein [Frankia sp. B2]|uniref:FxSxx-COOH system tetratricopeptide repeat protein n=1 Tax=unclassified Frankia TaxID=2632575 RepID=UPI000461F242|nr:MULTISPECIES: FxSxx-COOH system tetratricopeptide repeat protein [unclassified Frankia]KDA42783.1 ATPase involved in chromosome partitioning [Frankia sp. BMG5.23]TFE34920.1 tetratricopeptide repeat protein [Frankia sp. B2]
MTELSRQPPEPAGHDTPGGRAGRPAQIITFYSYKGGSGRTMALANVAWLLAASGKRVLTVDWDLESPGLHRYFRPFLQNRELDSSDGVTEMLQGFIREIDRLQDAPPSTSAEQASVPDADAVREIIALHGDFRHNIETIEWPGFPGVGRIDFLGPGRQTSTSAVLVATVPWSTLFEDADGRAYFAALRERMRFADYDYVLIDSRTGTSDAAGVCTQLLPDTVVIGFALNNQSIDGGAGVAREIRNSKRDIRVLPVPMRVEDTEQRKQELRRRAAFHAFRPVLADLCGSDPEAQRSFLIGLEIPYKAVYAYEEVLAAFQEDPASRLGVQAAYRMLAGELAGAPIDARPVPPQDRERVLRDFEQYGPPAPRSVAIFGAPEDRPWADWLVSVLGATGVRIRPLPPMALTPADFPAVESLIVIGSPHLGPDTPGESLVREQIQTRIRQRGSRAGVVVVEVGSMRLDSAYHGAEIISLPARNERDAGVVVLEGLGLPVPRARLDDLRVVAPRYPARRPRFWSVPARFAQPFVGRHAVLDELRDRLLPGGRPSGLCPLLGPDGVGKSAIAAEYAHRFDSDYDIVHWISAGDAASVRAGLRDLAERLRPGSDVPDAQRSPSEQLERVALDALRQGDPSARWLLVYDGAADPRTLAGLLPVPTGNGHVLLTSADPAWDSEPGALWVDPFTPAESRAFLRRWLPEVGEDRLATIAERLRHQPSGLRTAVGRLRQDRRGVPVDDRAVDAYLTQLAGVAPEQATWTVSFETLRTSDRATRRAAARLLELCAFLAPQGVPLALLESPVMLRHLAEAVGDDAIADPTVLPELWAEIRKPRLAEVDTVPDGQFRLAARWQRLLVERMQPAERTAAREAVLGIFADIAAAAPRPSAAAGWPIYRMLEGQILASEAMESPAPKVRQWLVSQVYVMWRSGRLELGRGIAEDALRRWRDLFGADDPLTLRMAAHLAMVLRGLGRFQEAYDLNTDTLARQRRHLGIFHRHTLITAMSYGIDIRELGRYAEAAAEESSTLVGFRDRLGDNHLDTLMAASNLALSTFLDGRAREALHLSLDTMARLRLAGAEGTSQFWWLQARAGICHRELGELEQAERLLREAATNLAGIEGATTHLTLRCNKHLAVVLRLRGSPDAASRLAGETLERYTEIYGASDLGTLACLLSRAGHLHALGEHHRASVEAESCLREYERLHGPEHPFTNICRSDLSIYLRADGRLAESRALAEQAHLTLVDELYQHHPFALAAGVNHAASLAALGETEAARALDEDLLRESEMSLDSSHPYLPIMRENLAVLTGRQAGGGRGHREVDIDISSI